MPTRLALPVMTRDATADDVPAIARLFDLFPSTAEAERAIRSKLLERNAAGIVAVRNGGEIVGFAAFHVHDRHLDVNAVVVAKDARGLGVARTLVERIKTRAVRSRRPAVRGVIPESRLNAHLFAKACGFKAVAVLRGQFDADLGEDGYEFRWEAGRE